MNIQNAHTANEITPEYLLKLAGNIKPVKRPLMDMALQASNEMRAEMEMPLTGDFYD